MLNDNNVLNQPKLKNKKIGLVTLFNNNYGSILQCYATKTYVESLGFDCVVLEEKKRKKIWGKIRRYYILLYRTIKYKNYFRDKMVMKNAMKTEISYLTQDTLKNMHSFVNSKLRPCSYTWKQLLEIGNSDDYPRFIVGSDQVWNASRDIPDIYFLAFTKKNKKVAFGPSIGVSEIPEFNAAIKEKINDFNEISLREETAITFVREFYKKSVTRVGDPTIMLDGEEWRVFSQEANIPQIKYILLHFLNRPNAIALANIQSTIKKDYVKVIAVGYKYEDYDTIDGMEFINGNPQQYIALIANSSKVFTDSFHTTLFSINLGVQFYTYHRQYLHGFAQTSRISDLLKRYGLEERFIGQEDDIEKISGIVSSDCLVKDREVTRNFIKKQLGVSK